jgi:hypothetical protein
VVGVWPIVTHGSTRISSLVTIGILLAITLSAPALLARPKRLWQRAEDLLQGLVTQLVLAFLFYIVVAPMGMLMRLLPRSSLKWRRGGEVVSYWIRREPPGPKPDSLNHQF